MRNVHDIILEKIQKGEVHMIPRWRFVLTGAFWIVGLVVASLLAIYLASFVLFVVHRSGLLFVPGFGWRGIMFFVVMSPWMLISATLVFLGIVYVLVRQHAFSYKKPMVYSLISIVLGVLTVSLAIHMLAIHSRILEFSERHNLPGMSEMYHSIADARPEGIFVGTIHTVIPNGFILLTKQQTELVVTITSETRLPRTFMPESGLVVVIFGDEVASGEVLAKGIRVVPDEFMQGRDMLHTPPPAFEPGLVPPIP